MLLLTSFAVVAGNSGHGGHEKVPDSRHGAMEILRSDSDTQESPRPTQELISSQDQNKIDRDKWDRWKNTLSNRDVLDERPLPKQVSDQQADSAAKVFIKVNFKMSQDPHGVTPNDIEALYEAERTLRAHHLIQFETWKQGLKPVPKHDLDPSPALDERSIVDLITKDEAKIAAYQKKLAEDPVSLTPEDFIAFYNAQKHLADLKTLSLWRNIQNKSLEDRKEPRRRLDVITKKLPPQSLRQP